VVHQFHCSAPVTGSRDWMKPGTWWYPTGIHAILELFVHCLSHCTVEAFGENITTWPSTLSISQPRLRAVYDFSMTPHPGEVSSPISSPGRIARMRLRSR
jgi:hypothetical protein